MAKGKHAAALFEVIHASRQYSDKQKTRGLLRTPSWWFKSRKQQPAPAPEPVTSPPPAAAQASPPDPALAAPIVSAEPASIEPPLTTTKPPAVDMLVDPSRHQITFRVTYSSAIVTAFAVVVVVALAYIVGRHMARGPAQALGGPSSEQLLQGPARPDVMEVGSTRGTAQPPPNTPTSTAPPVNITAPPATANPQAPPAFDGRRTQGLNYVIIQSYPDEASAKAAVDILQQHGVISTIEKALPRFGNRDWHVVVGVEGFSRISGPEYAAYVKKIESISAKFANRRSFKAFEPMPYKWDRP